MPVQVGILAFLTDSLFGDQDLVEELVGARRWESTVAVRSEGTD